MKIFITKQYGVYNYIPQNKCVMYNDVNTFSFKTITLFILAFLDRYGIGTVPLYLSTSVNESLILYRSDPRRSIMWVSFRNKLFWYNLVCSVCNVDRWIGTVPEQVWTHAIPYRSKLYRNSLYRYGTAPDMFNVYNINERLDI